MNLEDLLSGDEEIVDITISNGTVVQQTDKIALIDADTIAYAVCSTTEYLAPILPQEFYSDEEWEEITSNPSYTEGCEEIAGIDIDLALSKVETRLQDLLDATGCKDYELHFSTGKHSFRHIIYPEYKANRTNRIPAGISEVKALLSEKYPDKVFVHSNIEADDAVCYLYDNTKYILCAVDKDVLYSIEGKHWNYYHSALHGIDPKWVEVDSVTAMKNKFIQTLTGDRTDNIPGINGVGVKKANKALAGATTEKECWEIVLDMYKKNDMTVDDAVLSMRLVNMEQATFTDGKFIVNLWEESDLHE